MSLILCLETATGACSVALIKNGKLIESRHSDKKNSHSSILNILINEIITSTGIQLSDLRAIAVSKGPGSYTGLRIGVSTAKGLCYGLNIPAMAPDTLLCMASGFLSTHPVISEEALLCPMIDARRMEVFAAVYDLNLKAVTPVDAVIVDNEAFPGLDGGRPVYYFGDGAEKCFDTMSKRPNWHYSPGFVNSASHMASLASKYFKSGKFEDVAYFEPFYLKDFVARKPVVKGLR